MKLFLAISALALLLGGCGSPCPEPYYDGAASDEAWRTMQDGEARATVNDAKAVKLSFPVEGEKLSAAGQVPLFKWTTPLMASLTVPPRTASSVRPASVLSRVGGWFYSSAWAHLPPVTAPLHLLRIKVPNRACPLEVLTTRTEWTPTTAAWADLKTFTSGTLTLDVFSAYLTENHITEGEFHLSKPVSFTVTK